MWRTLVSIGLGSFLTGAAWTAAAAEPTKSSPQQRPDNDLVVGEPIRHGNLTIFPVVSRTPRDADRFITLGEGLKAGTVTILELGGGRGVSNINVNAEPAAQDDPFAEPEEVAEPTSPNSETAAEEEDPFGESPATDEPTPSDSEPAADEEDTSTEPAPTNSETAAELDDLFDESASADEQSGGSVVNRIVVINNATKPLYLMPGEIIVGGDQDRTIGREYVIQPSQEPVEIEVFCVEHGRWGGRDVQALASLVVASTAESDRRASVAVAGQDVADLAKQANSGKFIGSVGNVNKSARIVLQERKGQSAVWDEVRKENTKSGVKAESDAFTGQYAEEDSVRRLDPYLAKLQTPVTEVKQVVGVIVAVNDKVDSVDILESTPLFQKLWPKLLKSYALDAANADPVTDTEADGDAAVDAKADAKDPPKPCTREDALAFLAELQQAEGETQKADGGIALTRHVSRRLSASSAFDLGAGGGFGAAIHSSGFAK